MLFRFMPLPQFGSGEQRRKKRAAWSPIVVLSGHFGSEPPRPSSGGERSDREARPRPAREGRARARAPWLDASAARRRWTWGGLGRDRGAGGFRRAARPQGHAEP